MVAPLHESPQYSLKARFLRVKNNFRFMQQFVHSSDHAAAICVFKNKLPVTHSSHELFAVVQSHLKYKQASRDLDPCKRSQEAPDGSAITASLVLMRWVTTPAVRASARSGSINLAGPVNEVRRPVPPTRCAFNRSHRAEAAADSSSPSEVSTPT